MNGRAILAVVCMCLSLAALAQVGAYDVVNPSLAGLRVASAAAFARTGSYYEYAYRLENATPSTGTVNVFEVDISGVIASSTPPSAGPGRALPAKGITQPVGFVVPSGWLAFVTSTGRALWAPDTLHGKEPLQSIAPGNTSPPLAVRSYDAPGVRNWEGIPVWDSSDPRSTIPDSRAITVFGQVLGPVPLSAAERRNGFFRGGSNNPAEVDHFLEYRVPVEKTTRLLAGQKAFLVVHFGAKVAPGTFKARWNGQDISSRFTVVPDRFAGVELEPVSGRNVLVISIEGAKANGGTGTDTDRLIWEAP